MASPEDPPGDRTTWNSSPPGAALAPRLLAPGETLSGGLYTIEDVLGRGGFAVTYRAHDSRLDRPVAIKELFPDGFVRTGAVVARSEEWTSPGYLGARQRFLQEARTLARLDHPGIVKVYGAFEENETAYIAMEYVEGRSLAAVMAERGGRLSEAESSRYMVQAGAALEMVHRAGILHQDLKPSNIMIRQDGRLVLIDFGAAREYAAVQPHTRSVVLTPGYAPMEQYSRRARRGVFTDVYALSSTLYHLLAGEPPVSSVERAAGEEIVPLRTLNPAVSPAVERGIMAGLAMDPAHRPQSIRALFNLLSGKSETTSPAPGGSARDGEAFGSLLAGPRSPSIAVEDIHTLVVSATGPGHFRSVSEAVRRAKPGGKIVVRPGIYRETLRIDKIVEISATGPRDQVILESTDRQAVLVRTMMAALRGFTIRGRSDFGVVIQEGQLRLEDCAVDSLFAGIVISGSAADPDIQRCHICGGSYGISARENARAVIEDCDIRNAAVAGADVGTGATLVVRSCRISGGAGPAIRVQGFGKASVENCDLRGNRYPYDIEPGCPVRRFDNIEG